MTYRNAKWKVYRTSFMNIINYTYLLYDPVTRECAAVDPAWDISEMQADISKLELKLKYVLLTHSHYDHINKADIMTEIYPAQSVVSEVEGKYYSFCPKNCMYAADLDRLWLGEIPIICLLTPGHTAGSMCYQCGEMLFTGDTLFTEGCGYCKGAGADSHQMYHSIQKLRRMIPQDTIILPGHKFRMDIGKTFAELENVNIYLQIENEKQFSGFRDRSGQKGLFDFK